MRMLTAADALIMLRNAIRKPLDSVRQRMQPWYSSAYADEVLVFTCDMQDPVLSMLALLYDLQEELLLPAQRISQRDRIGEPLQRSLQWLARLRIDGENGPPLSGQQLQKLARVAGAGSRSVALAALAH